MSKRYYSLTLEGEFLSAFYLNLHVFLVADTENVTIEAKSLRNVHWQEFIHINGIRFKHNWHLCLHKIMLK